MVWKKIGEYTWDKPNKKRPLSTINPEERISVEKFYDGWNVFISSTDKESSKDFKTKSQALSFAKSYMRKNP